MTIRKTILQPVLLILMICLQYIKFRLPFDRIYSIILLFCTTLQALLVLSVIALSVIQVRKCGTEKHTKAFVVYFIFMLLLLFLLLTIPHTKAYGIINQKALLDQRQEIVEDIENEKMNSYQINTNQYILPDRYTFASENARVLTYDENKTIVFSVHSGIFAESGVIYSKSNGIDKASLLPNAKIQKLSENWFYYQKNYLVDYGNDTLEKEGV